MPSSRKTSQRKHWEKLKDEFEIFRPTMWNEVGTGPGNLKYCTLIILPYHLTSSYLIMCTH